MSLRMSRHLMTMLGNLLRNLLLTPLKNLLRNLLMKTFEMSPEKPSDDNLEESPEKTADHQTPTENVVEPPVIDLDEEFSDNDLIANVNPSIAKRMMSRKGKQNAVQSPSKEK